jgi:hypothetical protein
MILITAEITAVKCCLADPAHLIGTALVDASHIGGPEHVGSYATTGDVGIHRVPNLTLIVAMSLRQTDVDDVVTRLPKRAAPWWVLRQ